MNKKFNIFMLAGALLVFGGVGAIVASQTTAGKNYTAAVHTAEIIEEKLPDRTEGIEQMYSTAEMPALSVDGTDYIAMLKAEKYGITLPVQSVWDKKAASESPCRFAGSCYDGSMVIGAEEVHFAFLTQLDMGDKITVTDMLGAEFNYSVEKILRSDSAVAEKLTEGEYPLTLFTRYSKENSYIIVKCSKGV